MEKKIIDTREYVSMLRDLTENGKEVGMPVFGNSMSPFLVNERDYIYFKKPDRELRPGDMVFYQRRNGQFIMHRICKVKPEGYYIIGDAHTVIEGPVLEEQIFALIYKVRRKGKVIGPEDFWWKFFQNVWIHVIPIRPIFHKLYRLVKR